MLEVISPDLVPEASFSRAHAYLSHWMLCRSLDALLALILCEVLSRQTRVIREESQKKRLEKRC